MPNTTETRGRRGGLGFRPRGGAGRRQRLRRLAAVLSTLLTATLSVGALGQHGASATVTTSTVAVVGGATTFASGNGGAPTTPLPKGVVSGDLLVAYVESYPFTTITCGQGWTKQLDAVNGSASRLAACTRFAGANESSPAASVNPPTQVSMITMAFSGADPSHPVEAAAGAAGLTSPSVSSTVPQPLLVLGEGSNTWQAVAHAPAGATLGATVNDSANSQVAVATRPGGAAGPTGASTWSTSPPSTSAASATLALRPTASTATPTPTPSPTASPTPTPGAGYPAAPPAQICGNATLLGGPSIQPGGSIRVDPGANLNTVTQAQPPGTTFWLSPGTFTVGTDPYGQVIPKDGDVYVGAPGAVLDGQHLNRYAFTQQAANVTISHLTIQNFGAAGTNRDEGVVNHDGGTGWTIEYDTIQNNAGAGVFIGSGNTVRFNCLQDNGQYGFSMYKAVQGSLTAIVLTHNEVAGNDTDDWETRIPGCGCTGGGKFWDAHNVTVTDNWVHDNRSVGLWADTDDYGFLIDGNYIDDNAAEGIFYEISYNARITSNTLKRNALVKGAAYAARGDNFPVAAVYLSESGGDSRVNAGAYSTLEVAGNDLEDNWGGVTIWENADRFCNSPANTSSSYCTLGGAASLSTCVQGTIDKAPYYSDCRWKAQNISVHDNLLVFHRADVGCTTSGCGQQAILSNFGTYPSWSPYQGTVIQDAIAYGQNNRFSNNHYVGDWAFTAYEAGRFLRFAAWQAAPYSQDAGSTIG